MVHQKFITICISIFPLFCSLTSQAFDLTKIHCLRQERQGDQIFLSEIHFTKTHTEPNQFEGELLSYSLRGSVKRYVSGYSLFSISYHDQIISGLTGDAITRTDGSFTLRKSNEANNGKWDFSYTNTSHGNIDAEFKCLYGTNDPFKFLSSITL